MEHQTSRLWPPKGDSSQWRPLLVRRKKRDLPQMAAPMGDSTEQLVDMDVRRHVARGGNLFWVGGTPTGLQLLKQSTDCRNLAERAKGLARLFREGPDRDRTLRYAEELEEQAVDLEKQVAALTWP